MLITWGRNPSNSGQQLVPADFKYNVHVKADIDAPITSDGNFYFVLDFEIYLFCIFTTGDVNTFWFWNYLIKLLSSDIYKFSFHKCTVSWHEEIKKKVLYKELRIFFLCTEPQLNRDPQAEVHTEPWLVCTVKPQ